LNDEERRDMQWNQHVESRIQASNIPRPTRGRGFDDLKKTEGNRKAFALVKSFLEQKVKPPILLLIGIPGVGKTTLAYIAAWDFLENGERVIYYQAEELLNDLQANLEDGKAFGRIWARLKEADLVILDDVGVQNRTSWRDAQLDTLVDYRYREGLPLVMTTNKLDLSERILDRVKEGASVVITGESWRGKGKEQ
jgi:DNA replication protein DnaC